LARPDAEFFWRRAPGLAGDDSPSSLTSTGLVKPNRLMLSAIWRNLALNVVGHCRRYGRSERSIAFRWRVAAAWTLIHLEIASALAAELDGALAT